MKILGEKSLSSKVIVGLGILFAIISFINLIVISIIMKIITHIFMNYDLQNNIFNLNLFIMFIITGIIALFIIYQFIKIFKNLKKNILFCEDNSKSLNIVSNSCFAISTVYFIIAIYIFVIMNSIVGDLIYYIFAFSLVLGGIFIVSGIGIKILNELYKKAIQYKQENDFTI